MAITLPIEIASRDLANLMGVMPRSVTDEQSTRYMLMGVMPRSVTDEQSTRYMQACMI